MIVGADGQKKAAIDHVSKKGRTSTLVRPIQHLYPMEVVSHSVADLEQDAEEPGCEDYESTSEESRNRPRRSRRATAAMTIFWFKLLPS